MVDSFNIVTACQSVVVWFFLNRIFDYLCRSGYSAARLQDLRQRQTVNTRASTDTRMLDSVMLS